MTFQAFLVPTLLVTCGLSSASVTQDELPYNPSSNIWLKIHTVNVLLKKRKGVSALTYAQLSFI